MTSFYHGLTFPKKLANSIGQLANLVCQLVCKWQVRGWRKFVQVGKPAPVSPGLQTVCQRWETSGLQTGFAKVCKPGRNFRRVCKITAVCYTCYTQFLGFYGISIGNFCFWWVGQRWQTFANVGWRIFLIVYQLGRRRSLLRNQLANSLANKGWRKIN